MVASKKITPPSSGPISTDEAKRQLNIESSFTDDDELVGSLILAATSVFEKFTNRQLMQASWALVMDGWKYDSDCRLQLPVGPVQSITSIKYYDTNNAQQTLSGSAYTLNNYDELALIEFTGSLPSAYDRSDSIIIEYVAGAAGADDLTQRSNIDEVDKRIIKSIITGMYEYRGDDNMGQLYKVSMSTDYLMQLRKLHPKVFFEYA